MLGGLNLWDYFLKRKKIITYTTTLNGNTAKGRQDLLRNLLQYHDDLTVGIDIKNNSYSLYVAKHREVIGTIDSKITRSLTSTYDSGNGLACNITIGQNYKITSNNDILSCTVTLTVIPD